MPRLCINCKQCGNFNPKGRQYCSDECLQISLKKRKVIQSRKKRILRTGFTKAEENQFLIDCMGNGIDTTGKIYKQYIQLGKKPRSTLWLLKRLKELGIYKEPDMRKFYQQVTKEYREDRIIVSNSKGFSVLTNDNRKTTKVRCNNCNIVISYSSMLSTNGCYKCKWENNKIEATKRKYEKQNKQKLDKFIKYSPRVDKIKKFVSKEENYTKYKNWRETPIHKEYIWYNTKPVIKFRDIHLTRKLQFISYYVYRTGSICPDTPKSIGYKICNKCREHKIETNFIKNQCKDCAKEYRREFSSPTEKLRMKEKYKNDPVYKLDSLLRAYIYGALKGKSKTRRIKEILGMDSNKFREYIEERFEDWMTWDNHGQGEGKWALQHIVPRTFATNEDEIYLLNYYKNLMPMCAVENGILQNRILKPQLNEWHKTNKGIQKIIKQNTDKLIS